MDERRRSYGRLLVLVYPVGLERSSWLNDLFGLPLSFPLRQPDGAVNNPLEVLHNLSLVITGHWVIFGKPVSLCRSHPSSWFVRTSHPHYFIFLTFLTHVSFLSPCRITFCHLPFQSKWLYIGTERGNIHIVNVESFMLSGYVIMWNKAIELWVLTAHVLPPRCCLTHFALLFSFSLPCCCLGF